MKAIKAGVAVTHSQALAAVAEKSGLKKKDVRTIITAYMELAAGELKKNGQFKIAGCLNLKLKKNAATPARKGVNPFTKEPCVFKAKPASKTVKAYALKKLKEMVEEELEEDEEVEEEVVPRQRAGHHRPVPAYWMAEVQYWHRRRREQYLADLEQDELYLMSREGLVQRGQPVTPGLPVRRTPSVFSAWTGMGFWPG